MPDEMDAVQERVLAATAEAIDRARAVVRGVGASECECGEPIHPVRQQIGAVRCIDCQAAVERAEAVATGRRT
jgi:RNA polymerase-binding transcription factor DksA